MSIKAAWQEAKKILVEGDIAMLREARLVIITEEDFLKYSRRPAHAPKEEVRPTAPVIALALREKLGRIAPVVEACACREMAIEPGFLWVRERHRRLVDARALYCLVLRRLTHVSWSELGRMHQRRHDGLLRICRSLEDYLQKLGLSTVEEVTEKVRIELKKQGIATE